MSSDGSASLKTEHPPHVGPFGLPFSQAQIKAVEEKLSLQNSLLDPEVKELENLLSMGKKASLWINTINANRPKDTWLDLSSPKKSGGIPYSDPLKNNTSILKKRLEDFLLKTHPQLVELLISNETLPSTPPLFVSDEEFVNSMRSLDRIYQATIRWAKSREWLSWYINKSIFDVRAFLHLGQIPNLEIVLKSYPTMPSHEQSQYTKWLIDLCKNGDFDPNDCRDELISYLKRNNLFGFYERFKKYGQKMYDLFFTIKKTRPEIFWDSDKNVLTSPFQIPQNIEVQDWLKFNVEAEWSKNQKYLILDFKKSSEDIPSIQFKSGVTANVNGIAGNLITMESEYPLSSLDQMWTIRHEYGHVIGFEDCYLEFYDTNEKAMIYYEIDVDNLMCSRNGKIQDSHFKELLKAY